MRISDWSSDVCSSDLYNWRAVEARLNAHPQFLTPIDGVQIHFFHIRAKSGRGRPLLLLHGWPGSQIEFLDLIDALCAPGDTAADQVGYDLVIPAIPGLDRKSTRLNSSH